MLNRGYKSRVNGSFFLMCYFPMLALCAVGFIVTTTSAMGDPEVSGEVVDVSVRIRPADHSLLPNVREIGEVRVDLMEKTPASTQQVMRQMVVFLKTYGSNNFAAINYLQVPPTSCNKQSLRV